jgi:hypothetical protein
MEALSRSCLYDLDDRNADQRAGVREVSEAATKLESRLTKSLGTITGTIADSKGAGPKSKTSFC